MNRTFILTASAIGSTIGGVIYFKEFLQGCRYTQMEDLSGRTAIVTGANTGIGKETAKEFAKRGAKVIMACRDMKKCREARIEVAVAARSTLKKREQEDGIKRRPLVRCEELDLASFESIRAFANKIEKEKRIHYLIDNAASMRDHEKILTKDGLEKQMGINHFGHFLLTNLLLPKIMKSAPSRIVVVSSTAHNRGDINFDNLNWDHDYSPAGAYNASKLANVLFARQLAKKLNNTGVLVFSVHPGLVNTEIFRNLSYMRSLSRYIFQPVMFMFLKTPRAGAQTSIYAALSPDVVNISGAYLSNCGEVQPSEKALDDVTAERLWIVSEKWTRLNEPLQPIVNVAPS